VRVDGQNRASIGGRKWKKLVYELAVRSRVSRSTQEEDPQRGQLGTANVLRTYRALLGLFGIHVRVCGRAARAPALRRLGLPGLSSARRVHRGLDRHHEGEVFAYGFLWQHTSRDGCAGCLWRWLDITWGVLRERLLAKRWAISAGAQRPTRAKDPSIAQFASDRSSSVLGWDGLLNVCAAAEFGELAISPILFPRET
jgi:hypothetical protein